MRIRMMGGTVPTGAAVEALWVPFAIVPLVNADNNQHSFDENMQLGNHMDGVKGLVGLQRELFWARRRACRKFALAPRPRYSRRDRISAPARQVPRAGARHAGLVS